MGNLVVNGDTIERGTYEGMGLFFCKYSKDGQLNYIKGIGTGFATGDNGFEYGNMVLDGDDVHYFSTHWSTHPAYLEWGDYQVQVQQEVGFIAGLDPLYARLSDCNTVIQKSGGTLSINEGSEYQWYLGENELTGAIENVYIPTVPGNYWAEVTWSDGCTVKTHEVKVDVVTGISSLESLPLVNLYPNPVKDVFYLEFHDEAAKTISVLNMLGDVVFETTTDQVQLEISSASYASGIYALIVESNSGSQTLKLVKR